MSKSAESAGSDVLIDHGVFTPVALFAKWARRHWARMLVANLKLPMKRKAEMVIRLREVLSEGGWTRIRIRQRYHDRDEITVAAARA